MISCYYSIQWNTCDLLIISWGQIPSSTLRVLNFFLNYVSFIIQNADAFSGTCVYNIKLRSQKQTLGVVTETAGLIIPDYNHLKFHKSKYYTGIVDIFISTSCQFINYLSPPHKRYTHKISNPHPAPHLARTPDTCIAPACDNI